MFSELVEINDKGYVKWSNHQANNTRLNNLKIIQKPSHRQVLEEKIRQEHVLWENTLRHLLNIYLKSNNKRILKYNSKNGRTSYKEIDFIAEIDNSLIFSEFKFREHCDQEIKRTRNKIKKNLNQILLSYDIAKEKYNLLNPILIIVDMSFVFNITYLKDERHPDYTTFSELINQFKKNLYKNEISTIWLNSKEIYEIAKLKKLLLNSDRLRFKKLKDEIFFEEKRDDIYFSTLEDKNNNPFSLLKDLYKK